MDILIKPGILPANFFSGKDYPPMNFTMRQSQHGNSALASCQFKSTLPVVPNFEMN